MLFYILMYIGLCIVTYCVFLYASLNRHDRNATLRHHGQQCQFHLMLISTVNRLPTLVTMFKTTKNHGPTQKTPWILSFGCVFSFKSQCLTNLHLLPQPFFRSASPLVAMEGAGAASPSAPRVVPVPSAEVQELMVCAAQYTEMAGLLRQKGELDRAIRTMERAVGMCTKAETWMVEGRAGKAWAPPSGPKNYGDGR